MLFLNIYKQKYPNNTTPVVKTRLPYNQPLKADTLSFKGLEEEKPPEVPEFLKEHFANPTKKGTGPLMTAVIMLGSVAAMMGTVVFCTTFLPAAIAGIPIFIICLGITMWSLNKTVPTEKEKKLPPFTPEQERIAIIYHSDEIQYNRRQRWRKRRETWNNFQNNVQTFIANITKPFKSTQK